MTHQILLTYSTIDGHTVRICQRIQQVTLAADQQVTLLPLAQADAPAAPPPL